MLAWQGRFLQLLGEKEAGRTALDAAQRRLNRLLLEGENVDFEQGLLWLMRGRSVESQESQRALAFYLQSL